MNSFHELVKRRRSIRRFKNTPVDAESVKMIMEAALMAPTSKSSRSWRFIIVEEKEQLEKLALCKPAGAVPLSSCPLAIVVCGDSAKSDPWIEDASIAAVFMQLQAESLGLGSCWVQVRGRFTADGTPSDEYVAEQLMIPEEISVECIIAIGHKDEERRPIDPEKLEWEKVSIGTWK